jgi:hypothetical protein
MMLWMELMFASWLLVCDGNRVSVIEGLIKSVPYTIELKFQTLTRAINMNLLDTHNINAFIHAFLGFFICYTFLGF